MEEEEVPMRVAFAVFMFCAVAGTAVAQDDAEGSHDHPMLSRMPGYYIDDYTAQDFSAAEFDLEPPKKVEGRYWKISYRVRENAKKAGPVQIARNYTDLLVKRGGSSLMNDVDAGGGTAVARMPTADKSVWLEVSVSDAGESYDLTVVEEAAMEQQVEFTAMVLAAALRDTGSVSLHGILFDTGKATIRPESAAELATIAEALKNDPTLALEVRGHTDNVGAPAANLKLSQDRAAAVKGYLVQTLGVEPSRLATSGLGDTKPVADNATDAGRAQNRRVELVKRP